MPSSKLELRSSRTVAIAYVVAAGVAGLFFGLETLIQTRSDPAAMALNSDYTFEDVLVSAILAAAVCLFIEISVITPLLLGFKKYNWSWLNGFTGSLLGFSLAGGPALLIGLMHNADGTSELIGYYAGGHLTSMGWHHAISNALWIGPVGMVCAIVFRIVAVRSCSHNQEISQ